ncbi:hypothetical protein ACSBR1_029872 [Camellia fascicularis]
MKFQALLSFHKFPKILNRFSVKPNSAEAKITKKTIEVCTEMPAFKGEQKYCATSLESMIDFCTSMLGKRVKALSTELEKETQLRKYSAVGFKKIGGGEVAVCHVLKYPYAVFSCHNVHSTKGYYGFFGRCRGGRDKSERCGGVSYSSMESQLRGFSNAQGHTRNVPI